MTSTSALATKKAWLQALQELSANITHGRRRTSVTTRERIGEALTAIAQERPYDAAYVTVTADLDCVYVAVQASAAEALVSLLRRAQTSVVDRINLTTIPDQRLKEIAIRLHPRPSN